MVFIYIITDNTDRTDKRLLFKYIVIHKQRKEVKIYMNEKEIAESIEALISCLRTINDNGCFFDKLVGQMAKLTDEIENASYMINKLAKELECK